MSGRGISRGRAIRPGSSRGGGTNSPDQSGTGGELCVYDNRRAMVGLAGAGDDGSRRGFPPTVCGRPDVGGDQNVGSRRQLERREATLEDYDVVWTRPDGATKQGTTGDQLDLTANYFAVNRTREWTLIKYHVEFVPEQEFTPSKKFLLRQFRNILGAYIFDGSSLYTSQQICPPGELMELVGEIRRYQNDPAPVPLEVTIRPVETVRMESPQCIQFFNLVVRTCQQHIELKIIGRHYFDPKGAIDIPNQRLQLWPGFITVLRQHERRLLLCVEIIHRVIRVDTVLEVMKRVRSEARDRGQDKHPAKEAVKGLLVGTIVMTEHNFRTYRVDDILWNEKPTDRFSIRDRQTGATREISYVDYYKERYGLEIVDLNQPLLMSKPRKSRSNNEQSELIKLVPELCQMTGLTEDMRKDYSLMRDLGGRLFQPPPAKLDSICRFMQRMRNSPEVQADLQRWGLEIPGGPIKLPGRVIQRENLIFSDGRDPKLVESDEQAQWNNAFRNMRMASSVGLNYWVVVVPQRDSISFQNLLHSMATVGRSIGFSISPPTQIVEIPNINPVAYSRAIQEMFEHHKGKLQMVFAILGNNQIEAYSAVKKKCYVEYGVPSQCFLSNNLKKPRGLMSVATKVVVQMNTKLGGEPWRVQIPLKKSNVMFVGFDVHHGKPGSNAHSISAMVCTTTTSYGRYFSTTSFHDGKGEISTKIGSQFSKCLEAWRQINHTLPDRVFFYRDGVGEGQLHVVCRVELEAIKACIKIKCEENQHENIKLTFIVVTKRINSRLFFESRNGECLNPPPGTVVDDEITLPERWDFLLIAQLSRQGTASPTGYNIIHDTNELSSDQIQRLTYKLCHAYYNWSGTVAVPAPCQYAHKLAYLTGVAIKGEAHQKMRHLLYFL